MGANVWKIHQGRNVRKRISKREALPGYSWIFMPRTNSEKSFQFVFIFHRLDYKYCTSSVSDRGDFCAFIAATRGFGAPPNIDTAPAGIYTDRAHEHDKANSIS